MRVAAARRRRAQWIARSLCPLLVLAAFSCVAALADGTGDGLAAFKAGRYQEALDVFRREAEARLDSPDALANVGAALSRLGRHEEAVAELERALTLGPSPRVEAAIRYDLATAQLGLDRVEAAIDNLESSLRLVPDDVQAKTNLEIALRRRRDPPPPPPPTGAGSGGTTGPSAPPPPSSAATSSDQGPAPRMTREEAERLLDALGRRERLEYPRTGRRPVADPSAPDW